MRRMIQAESEAANAGDISIIRRIFAPDAVIRDASNGNEWTDPIKRYGQLFGEFSFAGAINYSVSQVGNNGREVTFRSASRGTYVNRATHKQNDYNNPPGSNEWVFRKNNDSCWVISRFTFNMSSR